ncbi:hypothetical protein D9M72_631340 [compost metagenome]
MQVLLPLEEIHRPVDAVDPHVRPAVGLHAVAPVVAARRFQAHLGDLVAGIAAVGEQEERLAGHWRVVARLHRILRPRAGERQQRQQEQDQRERKAKR